MVGIFHNKLVNKGRKSHEIWGIAQHILFINQ